MADNHPLEQMSGFINDDDLYDIDKALDLEVNGDSEIIDENTTR